MMITPGPTDTFPGDTDPAQAAGSSFGTLWSGHDAWCRTFRMQPRLAHLFQPALPARNVDPERGLARLFNPAFVRTELAEIRASPAGDRAPSLADIRKPHGGWQLIMCVGIALAAACAYVVVPNQIRGSAPAVAGAAQWLASLAWQSANIGLPVTCGVYTAFALLTFLFVRICMRESRGVELEAMRG